MNSITLCFLRRPCASPTIPCVRQRRALWGAGVWYEYEEPGLCHNASNPGSSLFADRPSQALHFEVAFSPDDEAGDDENEQVYNQGVSRPDLCSQAQPDSDEGIQGGQTITNSNRSLERDSSIDHLVVDVAPVRDE